MVVARIDGECIEPSEILGEGMDIGVKEQCRNLMALFS
jgi:hypothetical protein